MPSRDTVQSLMIVGIIGVTAIFVIMFVWLLKVFFVPVHGERSAGALVPFVILPISALLAGLVVHFVAYKILIVKYGKDIAEKLVFFGKG
jgi:hypothetical protein